MPPPPNGKPYSTRTGNDPVIVLVKYLEAWMAAGRPRDVFTVETEMVATAAATSGYTFTPAVAAAFTNLGNCVTNAAGFQTSTSGMMESMDELFAGAEALPQTLAETDLTTFDSETLATTGVIAYVPTYPLWSAGSGKLRHIRVPRGQHVTFDKATQSFQIPPNTRFYKTFFRKVDRPRRPRDLAQDGDAPHRRASRRHASRRNRQADGAVRDVRLDGRRDERDAGEPALSRRDAVRRSGAHVHHRRARLPGRRRQRRPGRQFRGRAAGGAGARARAQSEAAAALRDPGPRPLRAVPHGQPDQGLRARLLPAAGRPARDRHGRHLRPGRRGRAVAAPAPDRLRRHQGHDLARRRGAAGRLAGNAQAAHRR